MKNDIIGCNIKPGHTPGGFTVQLAANSRRIIKRTERPANSEEINEKANIYLERRGFVRGPSPFERTGLPNPKAT